MDMIRELAPGTKPLVCSSSGPLSAHAGLGAREETAAAASISAPTGCARHNVAELLYGNTVPIYTLHAEPGTLGDLVQADAVGMIGYITPLTQEQHILVIGSIADRTRSDCLLFLRILVQPCKGIELGDLFLVFDFVCGQKGSCSSSLN